MQKYITPEMEIVQFEQEDVITTSCPNETPGFPLDGCSNETPGFPLSLDRFKGM